MFVYLKDQMNMLFVWIEVRPGILNLGCDNSTRQNFKLKQRKIQTLTLFLSISSH